MEQPPVILGYLHARDVSQSSGGDAETGGTYLQLFLSLEPPLSTLPPLTDKVSFDVGNICLEWLKPFFSSFIVLWSTMLYFIESHFQCAFKLA